MKKMSSPPPKRAQGQGTGHLKNPGAFGGKPAKSPNKAKGAKSAR